MRTVEKREWATTYGNVGDNPEPPVHADNWRLAAAVNMGNVVWWYWERVWEALKED